MNLQMTYELRKAEKVLRQELERALRIEATLRITEITQYESLTSASAKSWRRS
jgi:hypothetical protein